MPDNLRKKGKPDRRQISQQSWEQKYAPQRKNQLKQEVRKNDIVES